MVLKLPVSDALLQPTEQTETCTSGAQTSVIPPNMAGGGSRWTCCLAGFYLTEATVLPALLSEANSDGLDQITGSGHSM